MSRSNTRRQFLTNVAMAAGGLSMSGWFPAFGQELVASSRPKRHCILLWMSGGPTQTDTFDMKVDHENGGEFKEIATVAPGVRFSEHLPLLAKQADQLALVRGLSTKEGDHGRGTYLMRTGRTPMSGGDIQHPAIGASLSKQLDLDASKGLPGNVAVGAFRALNREAFSSGFLGPKYGPLLVASDGGRPTTGGQGFVELKVDAMSPPDSVTQQRMGERLELWEELQQEFVSARKLGAPKIHRSVYQSAVRLMNSEDASAFQLDKEPEKVRQAYGNNTFGQGCLLARRLIERGVAFVEVTLDGWDTHSDNFDAVRDLSAQLDQGWATLMQELRDRDLLDQTTILWMGEFGRTPNINSSAGRDHFPSAWSCVIGGGGVAGGQVHGKTSKDGMEVIEDKTSVQDVLATVCQAVGVDPLTQQVANTGRPIPIVDGAPIGELLT